MSASTLMEPKTSRFVAYSRMDDEQLAAAAAGGDRDAFAALYGRYAGQLEAYCRSILLNSEDARDATQAALENALRALPRREPDRALKPWLYRIAHNEAISVVRRRRPAEELSDINGPIVPGPDVDAEQRTRLHQLVSDLRSLPERQRGALVMRELSGLGYDEIAVALGVTNEAARRAVFDARTALHDAVDGRATECVSVRRCISDGDRRSLRARRIRAHLRSCNDCASFQRAIGRRSADLHALGPWLPGTTALGMLGVGAGKASGAALVAAGGGTLVATVGGGGAVATGGGLGWAGLPAAVKGLAVAAAVATTGAAAVELPKVASPDKPAAQAKIASAPERSPADSKLAAQLRLRARAAAADAARQRRARSASRTAADRNTRLVRQPVAPAATMRKPPSAVTAPPPPPPPPPPAASHAPAKKAPATSPRPTVSTPVQTAIDALERIRQQIRDALAQAKQVADDGTGGSLALANEIVRDTVNGLWPTIERILAPFGLSLPEPTFTEPAATAPTTATPTTIFQPVQQVIGGIGDLLDKLFGRTG